MFGIEISVRSFLSVAWEILYPRKEGLSGDLSSWPDFLQGQLNLQVFVSPLMPVCASGLGDGGFSGTSFTVDPANCGCCTFRTGADLILQARRISYTLVEFAPVIRITAKRTLCVPKTMTTALPTEKTYFVSILNQ